MPKMQLSLFAQSYTDSDVVVVATFTPDFFHPACNLQTTVYRHQVGALKACINWPELVDLVIAASQKRLAEHASKPNSLGVTDWIKSEEVTTIVEVSYEDLDELVKLCGGGYSPSFFSEIRHQPAASAS